jgi:hypothetical protein
MAQKWCWTALFGWFAPLSVRFNGMGFKEGFLVHCQGTDALSHVIFLGV